MARRRSITERTGLNKHFDDNVAEFFEAGYDAVGTGGGSKRWQTPSPSRKSEDRILNKTKRAKSLEAQKQVVRNFSIARWMIRCHVQYVAEHTRPKDKAFNLPATRNSSSTHGRGRADAMSRASIRSSG